ncbi:hypothetical protein ACFS6H_00565 [Terrimonas rubra]|uniref:Oxygen tolerance n=1 Tax=Terrimonas rubra TaxID=1035890 RepID=A0ABW6A003_9BACT
MTGLIQYRILLVLFCFISASAFAQQATTIKATVDKNKILIGEHFSLTIETTIPENEPIRFIAIDSIPHFEFIGESKNDTTNKGGSTIIRRKLLVTSFDSGQWVIPPYVMADGVQSDSIAIDVTFSEFDRNQPYHDIKDVEDVPEEREQNMTWWIVAGIALLFVIIMVYALTRKKKAPATVTAVPALTAYRIAMQALQALQTNKPDSKTFHTTLSDVLRDYLDSRLALHTNQQTTNQLLHSISAYLLQEATYNNVKQALLLGDFVKFAKFTPQPAEDDFSLEAITASIQHIENLQQQQEAAAQAHKNPSS